MGIPQQRPKDSPEDWNQDEASLLEGLYQMAVEGRVETSECQRLATDVYSRLEASYADPSAAPDAATEA